MGDESLESGLSRSISFMNSSVACVISTPPLCVAVFASKSCWNCLAGSKDSRISCARSSAFSQLRVFALICREAPFA
jgi:hypothetical protein